MRKQFNEEYQQEINMQDDPVLQEKTYEWDVLSGFERYGTYIQGVGKQSNVL
jgi:hypothetical protein